MSDPPLLLGNTAVGPRAVSAVSHATKVTAVGAERMGETSLAVGWRIRPLDWSPEGWWGRALPGQVTRPGARRDVPALRWSRDPPGLTTARPRSRRPAGG